jgi:hypothetical protein
MVGGTVAICDDHARLEDWPEGADEWIFENLVAVMDEMRGPPTAGQLGPSDEDARGLEHSAFGVGPVEPPLDRAVRCRTPRGTLPVVRTVGAWMSLTSSLEAPRSPGERALLNSM